MSKAEQQGGAPPQAAYPSQAPPAYSQGATTVIVNQPPALVHYGDTAVNTTCPHCAASIITTTEYKIGMMVWLAVGIVCLFGLWCGCCLIPCCISSLKDVIHTCPNCNREVGRKDRLGAI